MSGAPRSRILGFRCNETSFPGSEIIFRDVRADALLVPVAYTSVRQIQDPFGRRVIGANQQMILHSAAISISLLFPSRGHGADERFLVIRVPDQSVEPLTISYNRISKRVESAKRLHRYLNFADDGNHARSTLQLHVSSGFCASVTLRSGVTQPAWWSGSRAPRPLRQSLSPYTLFLSFSFGPSFASSVIPLPSVAVSSLFGELRIARAGCCSGEFIK